jgi:superfamily II DNA or RNA helicase
METKYEYQVADVDRILAAFESWRRVLYYLPTGGGKTFVAAQVMQRLHGGVRVLVLAHRRELLDQARRVFNRLLGFGPDRDVVLLSVVGATKLSDDKLARFGLVIVDEAHRAGAPSYRALLARMPGAHILGLSGSPHRANGLRDDFDMMVSGPDVVSLVQRGVILCPRYWSVVDSDEPDLSSVKVCGGDWAPGQLERAMNRPHLVGHIVREWQARARGCSTLVFASGVKHAVAIAAKFVEAGVDARAVTGKSGQQERDDLIRGFESGAFPVLVNPLLLIEGFDVHRIDCLIIARASRSRVVFVQMVGRAMRPSPTRRVPLIHDHSGAWRWHGLPTTPREWTLDTPPKSAGRAPPPRSEKQCPECGAVNASGVMECVECGASLRRVDESRELLEVLPPVMNCTDTLCDVLGGRALASSPRALRARVGRRDPMCWRCAFRKGKAGMTPEQRSEAARKGRAALTPEQRIEVGRKGKAGMTPEQRSEAARKAIATWTPKRRNEHMRKLGEALRKAQAAMTPEQRSDVARERAAKRTPEQRSEASRKAQETRKRDRGRGLGT